MTEVENTLVDKPAVRLSPDASFIELLLGEGLKALDPQDAIDLGSALIALGKHSISVQAPDWGPPEEQREFILANWQGSEDRYINFTTLVAAVADKGGSVPDAFKLAEQVIDSDHGSYFDVDWSLIVGRSRRLELVFQMLAFVDANPDEAPALEAEIAKLSSRELRERLLSL